MSEGMDVGAFNQQVIAQFRETGGVGSAGPVDFGSLVLLTTTGRRSGQARTIPLGYCPDAEGNLLLFASNMGAPKQPDWCTNIEADPHVHVEVTGASWDATAVILDGAAHQDAYDRWIAHAPHVAGHQAQAGRVIPMVRVPAQR